MASSMEFSSYMQKEPQPPQDTEIQDAGNCTNLSENLEEDIICIPRTPPTIFPVMYSKSGRSKGDTEEKKGNLEVAIITANNELTKTILKEVKKTKKTQGTQLSSEILKTISDEVRQQRSL